MREATFAIDFLENKTFQGYTQDEEWNGFACPYFSFEQGRQLIEVWRERGWSARYDDSKDEFTFQMNNGKEEGSYDSFPAIEVEGKKLYAIGAFNWIWDEV